MIFVPGSNLCGIIGPGWHFPFDRFNVNTNLPDRKDRFSCRVVQMPFETRQAVLFEPVIKADLP